MPTNQEVFKTLSKSFKLLSKPERVRYVLFAGSQVVVSSIDLLAIAMIGSVGTILSTPVVESRENPDLNQNFILNQVSNLLGSGNLVIKVLVLAVILLVIRSALSIFFIKRSLQYLAAITARVSAEFFTRYLAESQSQRKRFSTQRLIHNANQGTSSLILGVLGIGISIWTDFAILLSLSLYLLLVYPTLAIPLSVLLALTYILLHRVTSRRAGILGQDIARFEIQSRNVLVETISNFEEMFVRGTLKSNVNVYWDIRKQSTKASADSTFMPNLSKYVLEAAVLISAVVLAGIQVYIFPIQGSPAELAAFMLGGFRLSPALVRIQSSWTSFMSNAGQAFSTHEIYEGLKIGSLNETEVKFPNNHKEFKGTLELKQVSFSYDPKNRVINDVSIYFPQGFLVALVGESGSGKSTFLSLVCGLIRPDSGNVLVGGLEPREAIQKFPGAMAYVPQEIWIREGTLGDNLFAGFEPPEDANTLAIAVISRVGLRALFPGENILNIPISENGSNLSGGQKQRIALARALLLNPKLLILDEPTSALDEENSQLIFNLLESLSREISILIVTHSPVMASRAKHIVTLRGSQFEISTNSKSDEISSDGTQECV